MPKDDHITLTDIRLTARQTLSLVFASQFKAAWFKFKILINLIKIERSNRKMLRIEKANERNLQRLIDSLSDDYVKRTTLYSDYLTNLK